MMKKVSDIFKSIRFATIDPKRQGEGHKGGSTDDEGHYTVGEKEYGEQLKHVKKRAGQEVKEEHLEEKNVPTSPEKWSQAKAQAKAKFDVYPSAYANGWAAKKYKEMGGGWKSVSEAVKDKFDIGEYDQEGDMVKSDLRSIIANAQKMHDMIEDADNLPEWVQSKITKAEDYISTVANYMTSEMNEGVDDKKHSFVAVHVKKGKHETHASTSYEAAQNAAKQWKMKNTSGISVYRADKTHVGEEVEQIEEGMMKRMATDKEEDARLSKVPFDKPYTTVKNIVTDKSGAKHGPMSRARDLARQAAKRAAGIKEETKEKEETEYQKAYKEARKSGSSVANARARAAGASNKQVFESRQLEIVKEAMKTGKKKKETTASEDKFQADPELTSQIVKVNQSN